LVYGDGEDELEHAVCRLLAARGKTLATVECGPGGVVAQWLTGISCPNFIGGLVIQSAQAATGLLGIPPDLMARNGPDTPEVATAMAERCREQLPADMVLAVGAFPPASEPPAPAGSVYYALSTASGTKLHSSPFTGHPSILRPRAAKQALNVVRLALLEQ
jgi:nicotinamide-nucleotide amidase